MANKLHLFFLLAIIGMVSAHVDFYEEMNYLASLTDIPTDGNFTVSTFIGDWNVVGTYGIQGISPHSCPTVDVKQTVTTSLVLTLTSINLNTSTYSVVSKTYQPNPLNKAVLVDILATKNRQNVAVSYYNDTLGLALLINMNSNFAVALSKSSNIYTDMYLETVNNIFIEAGLPLNQTVFNNLYGCTTNYTVAPNFNAKSFRGKYYGNAVFTTTAVLTGLTCLNIEIAKEETSNVYNLTQYLQYNDSTANISTSYVPSPSSPAFLINVDQVQVPSLVVNYYLAADNLFLLLAHDGSYGWVVSTKQSLDDSTLTFVKNILTKENLTVNANTFYTLPKTCEIGNDAQNFLGY